MADLGWITDAIAAYGDAREDEGRDAAVLIGQGVLAELRAELDAKVAALSAVEAEFAAYRSSHPDVAPEPDPEPEPTPEPTPTPTPTPTPAPTPAPTNHPILMGMSTDEFDIRVRETGPVESHRIFVPSFSVSSLVTKLHEANDRGVVPYWSLKFNTTWEAAAAGQDDALFRQLGNALAGLDFPTYGSFHHEPRGGSVSTPQHLVPWSQANVRAMNIVKPLAGPQHKLGTTDNGFPWGVKAAGAALNDAELAVYYTPALLAACDFLGGDFYDGKTDTNPGEPAAVKMAKFESWAARVAPGKPLAVGEWNAVLPADIYAAWDVLKAGPWEIACIFNSANNNRTDLPTDGSLGNPPSWVLRGDRLAAFRDLLSR